MTRTPRWGHWGDLDFWAFPAPVLLRGHFGVHLVLRLAVVVAAAAEFLAGGLWKAFGC